MKSKRFVALLIFVVLISIFSIGVTVRIVPTPFLYPTIQSAIDASSDSDVVLVIPSYTGVGEVFPITVQEKDIFIRGVASEFDTIPRLGLIPVRGQSGQPVFKYSSVTYGLLSGFTLTGGRTGILCENSSFIAAQNLITNNRGPRGAGILIRGSSAPVITNSVIENNIADSSGGGIYIEPMSAAVITFDTIRSNTAIFGGGIYVSGGLISGNLITSNQAEKGGGVFFDISAATFTNNRISSNRASTAGGGVYITNGSNPVFSADTFYNNTAPKGAGIFVNAYEDTMIPIAPPLFTLRNTIFESERARIAGGGIYISRRVLSVVWDCFFDGTSSDSVGGGMYIESPESLAIINSVFYRTKASRGGGGIYTSQPSKCYFKNCVFHSDTSSTGGAILLYFSSIPLSPPLISDNIFDNSNYPQNSVVYSNRSSVIFEYNRVPGSGSIVGFPLSGTNATGEPMFAYTTPTDFRLKLDSPCIDTGEPDSLYRDDDLSKCDMGVFGGPGAINPARPRKVEFLTVRADTSGIRLAWNPVIYPAFIKYAIYRENYPGFLPVELNGRSHRIDTTSSLTYLDSIIVGPADVFCYRVNAFINDTLVAGGYSNEACTTPLKIDETSTTKPELELLVYPNPFNSVVKLESPKGSEIEIFNTNGTLLCKLPQSSNFWLPSSEIPSGVYIIKAKTKEKILTKPVIYLK